MNTLLLLDCENSFRFNSWIIVLSRGLSSALDADLNLAIWWLRLTRVLPRCRNRITFHMNSVEGSGRSPSFLFHTGKNVNWMSTSETKNVPCFGSQVSHIGMYWFVSTSLQLFYNPELNSRFTTVVILGMVKVNCFRTIPDCLVYQARQREGQSESYPPLVLNGRVMCEEHKSVKYGGLWTCLCVHVGQDVSSDDWLEQVFGRWPIGRLGSTDGDNDEWWVQWATLAQCGGGPIVYLKGCPLMKAALR